VPELADYSVEQRMMIAAPRKGVIMTTVVALTMTVIVVTTGDNRGAPPQSYSHRVVTFNES
jgi:hypothetical protein